MEGGGCRPEVLDSHHFDKDQDPDPHRSGMLDPDPHKSEKMDPDPHWRNADPQPCRIKQRQQHEY